MKKKQRVDFCTSLSLGKRVCPQNPAAAAHSVQQVHYLDEAFFFFCSCAERMLLEGFSFFFFV